MDMFCPFQFLRSPRDLMMLQKCNDFFRIQDLLIIECLLRWCGGWVLCDRDKCNPLWAYFHKIVEEMATHNPVNYHSWSAVLDFTNQKFTMKDDNAISKFTGKNQYLAVGMGLCGPGFGCYNWQTRSCGKTHRWIFLINPDLGPTDCTKRIISSIFSAQATSTTMKLHIWKYAPDMPISKCILGLRSAMGDLPPHWSHENYKLCRDPIQTFLTMVLYRTWLFCNGLRNINLQGLMMFKCRMAMGT